MKQILFALLVLAPLFDATASPRPLCKLWGGTNLPFSILFRLNNNNIAGADFHVLMGGECTNPDGSTYQNTFDFGKRDFPDLMVNSRGKIRSTATSVTAGTGHVGDLHANCNFTKSHGKYAHASCLFSFDSPARGSEQLDSCVGGINFSRIVPAGTR